MRLILTLAFLVLLPSALAVDISKTISPTEVSFSEPVMITFTLANPDSAAKTIVLVEKVPPESAVPQTLNFGIERFENLSTSPIIYWNLTLAPNSQAEISYKLYPFRVGLIPITYSELYVFDENGRIIEQKQSEIVAFRASAPIDSFCDLSINENSENSKDCLPGGEDFLCTPEKDGRCDPDCDPVYDEDCVNVSQAPEKQSSPGRIYLILGAIFALIALVSVIIYMLSRR